MTLTPKGLQFIVESNPRLLISNIHYYRRECHVINQLVNEFYKYKCIHQINMAVMDDVQGLPVSWNTLSGHVTENCLNTRYPTSSIILSYCLFTLFTNENNLFECHQNKQWNRVLGKSVVHLIVVQVPLCCCCCANKYDVGVTFSFK